MKIQILDKTDKKKIIEQLSYLGIDEIPYLLIKTGSERITAYSGNLDVKELYQIWRLLPIEGMGLYFGKEFLDRSTGKRETRVSLDALHLLKHKIKKNIIEVNKEQEAEWFKGKNIELDEEQQKEYGVFVDFVAIKSGEDFIGIGKISHDKRIISNYLPKERRVRS